ncbi:MAG: glycosyl hydrolase, partial [Chloroflexota bacterium]|nr:glycosyl hydrolase [Chloroflexota bacterium]
VPYRLYAAQQDNTTMSVPSRAPIAGITGADAFAVGGGESGYIAVRPDDPNVVFAGNYQGLLTRHDRRSGQSRNIMVWPEVSAGIGARDVKYRFQWTFPIVLSPHDPNALYVTGNHVFRSRDEGSTWEILSPDLTRNDASKLGPSGGPITKDNTGAEYYCTIFAFAESPREPGVFWAGSDDGLVHVSRDGGQTWTDVTPRGIAPWTLISIIEPSSHDAATAYVAATRYKLDDFRPYLFKTNDHGRTWKQITAGIPDDDFTRVIREDPTRRGLLYAGTETGVYASFDDGDRWERLGGNLPVVPIHDLVIKDDDLVLATHGRAFWVLDDLGPLRQQTAAVARKAVHLYKPGVTTRFRTDFGFPQPPKIGKNYRMTGATVVTYRQVEKPSTGEKVPVNLDAGDNPPDGVVVHYALRERPAGEVKLAFLDGRGREIRSFTSKPDDEPAGSAPEQSMTGEGAEPIETASQPTKPATPETKEPRVPKERGLNRFVWNMRHPDAAKLEGEGGTWEGFERQLAGPVAVPGAYRVRLTMEGTDETVPFEIRKDPRVATTQRDFEDQFGLLMRIRDKVSETHEAINEIRRVNAQLDGWGARAKSDSSLRRVARAADKLRRKLVAIEEDLVQTKAKSRQDTLNFPIKLNAKLAGLGGAVASADFAPTRSSYDLFDDLSAQVDAQLDKLARLNATEAKAFNDLVRSSRVVALDVRPARAPRGRKPVRRAARRTIKNRS